MLLKKWDELPEFMKKEEVKPYFEVLNKKRGQLLLKRCFDILGSVLLILLLSPILLLFSIWIKLDSKGPVFYRQERITQYGQSFKIFKFRTMIINADQIGTLITTKNDIRITNVGEKIRKYRIDEIPQLFNVLIGEMSFVGTRPEVKKYVDAYTNEMYATLLLPAGITSIASIKFKDEDEILHSFTTCEKNIDDVYLDEVLPLKMEYNLKVIATYNFINEIGVLINTVMKV